MQAKDKGTAFPTMSNVRFPMPTANKIDYKGALGIGLKEILYILIKMVFM